MCLKFVIFLVVVGVTFCQNVEEYEDYPEENARREIRQYNQDDWRPAALSQQGNADWSPKDDSQETSDLQLKRRRLRKRKRRPPVFDDDDVYPERPLRRRVRPHRLDEIREPWEEMEEDAISKPNVRRRVTPVYQSSEEEIDKEGDNSENKPVETLVIVETEEASAQPQMNSISDLKKLLKQTGDISLSELLQQKNLSLSELLNGSEKAISALTERPQQVTQPVETSAPTVFETSNKYKRLPPSIALRKTTDRNYEAQGESAELLSAKETIEAQRKRLALLGSKENKLYSNVAKFDVVTEATTERRIFVPAHPKYYTSVIFKPDFLRDQPDQRAASTEAPATTSSTSTTTASPSTSAALEMVETTVKALPALVGKGYLPITNAKVKLTTKNEKVRENYPFSFKFPKPSKISLNEIFGFNRAGEDANEDAGNDTGYDAGEPLRIPIDIETSVKNSMEQLKTATDLPAENVTLVTAREEIMEIMKDPSARDSLSRILESRNMTVEELVEQRERGSSQLHLADIFHNNTREPEPKEEPFIGLINPGYFNGFKSYPRKQKSVNFGDKATETSILFTAAKPFEAVTVNMEIVTVKPSDVLPAAEEETSGNSLTFPWKQLYPDLFPDPLESEHQDSRESPIDEDDRRLEDIRSGYADDERYDDIDDETFLNIPSGVKSALFVSLAIIGLSMFVFLAILVVLRCLQKKTRASHYCSSLSSKMRPPMILQGRSTAALKTFVNETLGRKKNYVRSSMRSMSDQIWDSSGDRQPSF